MKFLLEVLLSAIAVIILGKLIPGIQVDSFSTAIWLAVILSILFAILKPIMVVLTFPVTIVTFGLFLLVINGLIVLLAEKMIGGFSVSSIWTAILFSILLSFFESILYKLID